MAITAVFVLEGSDISAYPSIEAAAAAFEVHDIKDLTYLTDDGTVLQAMAEGYMIRLTPTAERRPDELRNRLRAHLEDSAVGLDPGLADDPVSAAQALIDLHWGARRFRWFPWLDRRLNGTTPAPLRRDAGE